MSVTPSPIGGFAAQFFDNNGVILSGGKIYTYAAGTTTPQATYTSAAGATPHANPIILDSAGRVPGGEIWLTDGLVYKFVIETATGSLLGTYDNITGVNSNFVNYTIQEEVITATAGQTVFNLSTINYTPGTNSLSVYIDGVNQYVGDSYIETDSDTVTFTSGVHVGGEVKFTTAIQTTGGAVDASIVSYDPPFTGGVATTVENKLSQYVSVKDFGAVGDGVTNDAAAFNAALAASTSVYVPAGSYAINTTLNIPAGTVLFGAGVGSSITTSANINTFTVNGNVVSISGLNVSHSGNGSIVYAPQRESLSVQKCILTGTGAGAQPLIYTSGSFAAIRENTLTALRTFGPCVTLDRTGTVINIESHIEMNRFGGTGYGIRVISSDNSARPEGVYITNNSFICTDENLHIEQVLQCIVANNVFDQAGNYNIVLKPVNTGIQDIQFNCNYFSTPNQTTTGVCIFHDNTNPAVPLSQVGIVNNTFSFTGYGLVLNKGCVDTTVTSNTFTAIGNTGIILNEAAKIAIVANTFFAVTSNNLAMTDGATGGEFSVDSNQFASNVPVLRTVTNPANFFFGPTNTGRQLAGWSSTSTNNTASPSGSTITIPHGLDGTPPFTRINVSFVADTLVPTAAATAWVDSADATNIYAKVNFAVTTPGSYYVTAYASV